MQNTFDIFNANCYPSNSGNSIAANLCDNSTRGGYSNWFLPSRDELNLLWLNRFMINAAAQANSGNVFSAGGYWSSTEQGPDQAFGQYLNENNNGYQFDYFKWGTYNVRAIREFSHQPPVIFATYNTNSVMISNSGWNYVTVTDALGCTATDSNVFN